MAHYLDKIIKCAKHEQLSVISVMFIAKLPKIHFKMRFRYNKMLYIYIYI